MEKSSESAKASAVSCLFNNRIESVDPAKESPIYADITAKRQALYAQIAELLSEDGKELLSQFDEASTIAEREMIRLFYYHGFTDGARPKTMTSVIGGNLALSHVEERLHAIACHNATMSQISNAILMLVSDDTTTKQHAVAALSDILRDMASAIPILPSERELLAVVPV